MKSHLLKGDLQKLGEESEAVPRCEVLPEIQTFASGLGCLYVLEGSTLGARVISRRLESHFMLGPDSGAAFFNAYGEAVGRRWSEFRSFVTGNLSAEQAGETVKAAVETFESLLTWLKVPSRGMPDVVARVPPTATGS
jgi:heme oxygenase